MTVRQLRGAALALLCGLILLSGCDPDRRTLAFSHNLHVKDNGMACADCHGKLNQGRFALPAHAACMDCHGDWIETKTIGEKTCGMCHKVKDPKDLKALSALAPTNAINAVSGIFVHTAALSNRCVECHAQILDAKLKNVPEITHGTKVRIRDQAHGWGLDCQACHAEMNLQTPPANHGENWMRRHGVLGSQSDNTCGMCHREQSCRDCHQVTKPVSHNNLWRLKTHGVEAAWDRSRCLVCHQQDSCVTCHEETRPQSHNAGWRQNHCLNCHPSASTGTGCSLCHAGVGVGGTHPDPHGPGWRRQHCFSCHAGTPQADQCVVCHPGGGGNLQQIHSGFWPPVHNRFLGHNVDCFYCHEPVPTPASKPAQRKPRR